MRVTYWRDESLQKNDRSHIKAYALMSGILAQLVGSILVGIFGGQWIDNKVGTFPLFLIIGLLLGLGNRGIRNDSTHSTLLFESNDDRRTWTCPKTKEIYVLLACASSARMGIHLLQGCISWTDYRDDFQFS